MSNIIGELMSVVRSCVNTDLNKPLNELISDTNGSRINITTTLSTLYGKQVTCEIDGGISLTSTMSNDGTCQFNVPYLGTYTITCETYTSQCVVSESGGIYPVVIGNHAVLKITTNRASLYGKPVSCSMSGNAGTSTMTGHFSNTGECVFHITTLGTYTVTCEGFLKKYTVSAYNTIYTELFCIVYGIHISNSSESNPSFKVTYLEDAIGMTPAYMDYSTNTFNYGSWENTFFMPKPCMLKYDGTVDYYLNPEDYTKKVDGTSSDIANTSYEGNAMMEWGNGDSIIWVKYAPDLDTKGISIYFSDCQVDSNYNNWAFINSKNQQVNHFYTPIYFGSLVDSKLRSLSGLTHSVNTTASQEITYATNNNASSDVMWYTEVMSHRMLINCLLVLMAKSTDTQTAYGTGRCGTSSPIDAGTMNTKGLFWGSTDQLSGVKVFGMENYWGNIWRRIAGLITVNGVQKVKMTYGTYDGSTSDGYNITGDGYISLDNSTPKGSFGGHISDVLCTKYGINPTTASGSSSTHYTDGLWFNNSITSYALFGGGWSDSLRCGAFYVALDSAPSGTYPYIGAAISCIPC